jgi:hypothetical protein
MQVRFKEVQRRFVALATSERVASFLVPPLITGVLLYQVLTDLQIAIFHDTTLQVVGAILAVAIAMGAIAALGGVVLRTLILAAYALLFMDVTFRLSGFFDGLQPEVRARAVNDDRRIADIHTIKRALDRYVERVGALPTPSEYGEGAGVVGFWENWWDVSSVDGDGDKRPFLEFLVDGGILPSVPVDPVNEKSPDGDPRRGKQYVYFVVPPDYNYAGGACNQAQKRWHYLLGITDLELEEARPPTKSEGSGCACLWRDQPNHFEQHFDYVVCGEFDATPESRAQTAAILEKGAAAGTDLKQSAKVVSAEVAAEGTANAAVEADKYLPQDRRRVADLLEIQKGLQKYLRTVGPLPTPQDYGEAEASKAQGFWQHWWDVSSEDGDHDGHPFLDFLVESGTMAPVPIDPENTGSPDGDPRGGRQYVYFVVPPDVRYEGGSCGVAQDEWVYLLAITDLRSEPTRPPKRIVGPGCACLWRDRPDFFRQSFDYVVCGTFRR